PDGFGTLSDHLLLSVDVSGHEEDPRPPRHRAPRLLLPLPRRPLHQAKNRDGARERPPHHSVHCAFPLDGGGLTVWGRCTNVLVYFWQAPLRHSGYFNGSTRHRPSPCRPPFGRAARSRPPSGAAGIRTA